MKTGPDQAAGGRRGRRWFWGCGWVLAAVWPFWPVSGPRLDGKSVGYWFPQLLWIPRAEQQSAEMRRLRLVAAGPEALPILEAAVRRPAGPLAEAYRALRERAPERLRAWLPYRVVGAEHTFWVAGILREMARRDEYRPAILGAYDAFPAGVWRGFLQTWHMNEDRRGPPIPLMQRALVSPDPELTAVAAAGLSEACLSHPDLLPELVAVCGTWAPGTVEHEYRWATLRHLAECGTNAAAAMPWLRALERDGTRHEQALATLALSLVDPEHAPDSATLRARLTSLDADGLNRLLGNPYVNAQVPLRGGRRLLEVLAPLLDPVGAGMTPDSDGAAVRGATDLISALLEFIQHCGPDTLVLAPRLATLAGHPNPNWAGRAAWQLAACGIQAPETLPAAVTALTNAIAAPSLTLLVAAYGPRARDALPVLRSYAAGTLPVGLEQAIRHPSPDEPTPPNGGWVRFHAAPTGFNWFVTPYIARRAGRTGEWPLPEALRGRTNLEWGLGFPTPGRPGPTDSDAKSADGPASEATPIQVPLITLSELAREAVRRIEGGT